MKPTPEQIAEFALSDLDLPKPPSPYDIALAMGSALLSSGRYGDDVGAAMSMGWACVIPFYQGQGTYQADVANRHAIALGMSAVESRAPGAAGRQVGGEVGDIGEADDGAQLAVQTITPDPEAAAKWQKIADTTAAVQAAEKQLLTGRAIAGPEESWTDEVKAEIANLQQAFDDAAAAQSAAYE